MIEFGDQEGFYIPVFKDGVLAGRLCRFCCGWDFRPQGKPNALFSIMPKVFLSNPKLKKAVATLLSFDIPEKSFHFNFRLGKPPEEFSSYQDALNKLANGK